MGPRRAEGGISAQAMLVIAVAVFAFLGAQVALAGQGDGAETASHGKRHAKSSKIQLRELQAQLQAQGAQLQTLRIQLAALQSGGSAAPTGAAGGDLTGSYPNPQIAGGVITAADVNPLNVDGAAATPSLRTLGTGASQALAGNATAGGDLTGTFPSPTLAAGAVDAATLGTIVARFTNYTATDGAVTIGTQICDPGERLLSGGGSISSGGASADLEVVFDGPSSASVWRVDVANNAGGAGNVDFQVRALCLQ